MRYRSLSAFGGWWEDFKNHNYDKEKPEISAWCNQQWPYNHSKPGNDPSNKWNVVCRTTSSNPGSIYFFDPRTWAGRNQRALPGSDVGKATTTLSEDTKIILDFFNDPDQSKQEAFLRKIAKYIPDPLGIAVTNAPELIVCQRAAGMTPAAIQRIMRKEAGAWDKIDKGAYAGCLASYWAKTSLEMLASPEVQIALTAITGNIPGAIIAAVALTGKKLSRALLEPVIQKDINQAISGSGIQFGPQDFTNLSGAVLFISSSPDFVKLVMDHGAKIVEFPFFYSMIGGTIQAGSTPGSELNDIGWAIADHAEIFAAVAMAKGYSQQVKDLLFAKYIDPYKKGVDAAMKELPKRGRVIAMVGKLFVGLGAACRKISVEVKAYKPIAALAGPYDDLGKAITGLGSTIIQVAGTFTKPGVVPVDWEKKAHELEVELQKERAKHPPTGTSTPGPTQAPPVGSGSGVPVGALLGAGLGFVVGGPIGAGVGFAIGSTKKPASSAAPAPPPGSPSPPPRLTPITSTPTKGGAA